MVFLISRWVMKYVKGAFGKQHTEIFSNRTWKARERLALVHSYLCGLMETVSFGKGRYFPLTN
jgi:hypothetical protein